MILIFTHIVEDIDACCHCMIVIDGGKILFNGSCAELRNIALNKVYLVNEADLSRVTGEKYILRISELEGEICYRVLTMETQDYPGGKPSLEDGYTCLIKGFV